MNRLVLAAGIVLIILGFVFMETWVGCPSGPYPAYCNVYIHNQDLFTGATFALWALGLILGVASLLLNLHHA
jgi:hypothetical protein